MINSATSDAELAWFKSSYSSNEPDTACVEVAVAPGAVFVRDSKRVEGPRLSLSSGAWAKFVSYAVEA
ncbi:DUF397 domain-containing protein [Streptomyces sp. TRM70308]|uniref:DUF397 domain-containing protein n=1 Tax=Streptomyces sp. TRM70308 TaxID=3131932 RepID=UPI003D04E250